MSRPRPTSSKRTKPPAPTRANNAPSPQRAASAPALPAPPPDPIEAPGITAADRHLASVALSKIKRGESPSRDENAALRRVQLAVDDKKKWSLYRAIPQADWCKLSGRQRKVIRDQARKLNLPMGAESIDLAVLLPALHDLFSRLDAGMVNGHAADDADARLKMAKAEIAELQLAERSGRLVSRAAVQQCYAVIAHSMRKAAEVLGRHHGPEAQRILDERLDHAQSLLDAIMESARAGDEDEDERAGEDAA